MRGRKPKPSHLKVVTGNPGRRPMNEDEPKPKIQIPDPPPHLSADAKKAWPQVAQWLFGMRVLTIVDAIALERLCETYAELLRAQRKLKRGEYQKVVTKTGTKLERHPAVAMVQDADRRLRAWLTEFGLTPSSRSRVKGEQKGGQGKVDPLEEYFS